MRGGRNNIHMGSMMMLWIVQIDTRGVPIHSEKENTKYPIKVIREEEEYVSIVIVDIEYRTSNYK